MHPIAVIFSGGIVTLIFLISVLLSFIVGLMTMLGYWSFFIGWLLVGHGWQIGPININMLLLWIIAMTFTAWAGVKWASLKLGRPLVMFESFITWGVIFLTIFFGWFLLGHGLMYVATEYFMINTSDLDWLLTFYDKYDAILDTILAIPTIILIYIAMAKGYWKYNG